jgi:hypothetical protein
MEKIHIFSAENCCLDSFTRGGKHHDIYLSAPRQAAPEILKTFLQQPILKV